MGRWREAWRLGVCLVGMGCGSPALPSVPESPGQDERTSRPTQEDAGTPGAGSPLDAAPSLPPRACIPWTGSVPPVRATACASDAVFADGSSQHARYDADSHPLEVRFLDPGGALERVETHAWQDGLEVLRRTDYPSGSFDQTRWTYGSRSRLLRRANTGPRASDASSFDFRYDASGARLLQVIGRFPSLTLTSNYGYDAQGRLVSISSNDACGSNELRCATLTYWPNGRLRRHDWTEGMYDHFVNEYDEAGRLVLSTEERSDSGRRTTRSYDAAGRPLRVDDAWSTYSTDQRTLTTTVYDDPAGLRERFARDRTSRDPDPLKRQRLTRRTTFFCGTPIIALDEWDSDENGTVDAWRTHERDAATGRLVHEEYSGTPGLDDGPVRRDFRYTCP